MTSTAPKDANTPAPTFPRSPGVAWFGLSGLVNALGTVGIFYRGTTWARRP